MKKFFLLFFITIFFNSCSFAPKVKINTVNVKNFKNLNYDNTTFTKHWWEYFNDKTLNALINQSLKENFDIKIALSKLKQAEKEVKISEATLYPIAGIYGSRTKSKQHLHNMPPFIPSEIETRLYNVKVSASYEADVWGKYSNMVSKSEHNVKISNYFLDIVRKTVASNVAVSFFNVKALENELFLTNKIVMLLKSEKNLKEDRYVKGLSDILSVYAVDTQLKQQESLLSPIKAAIEANKYIINVFIGASPEKHITIDKNWINTDKLKLPSDLPSQVLLRRPDVRICIEKIFAQANFIGSSIADIFPAFKLTGQYGFENEDLSALIRNSSNLYSWIGEIFATVFDFGAKSNRVKVAKEALNQLKLEYYKKVLEVLKNVETSIVNFTSLKEKNKALKLKLTSIDNMLKIAVENYEKGIGEIFSIYSLQREKALLQLQIIDNENNIIGAYIKCLKEMGY